MDFSGRQHLGVLFVPRRFNDHAISDGGSQGGFWMAFFSEPSLFGQPDRHDGPFVCFHLDMFGIDRRHRAQNMLAGAVSEHRRCHAQQCDRKHTISNHDALRFWTNDGDPGLPWERRCRRLVKTDRTTLLPPTRAAFWDSVFSSVPVLPASIWGDAGSNALVSSYPDRDRGPL